MITGCLLLLTVINFSHGEQCPDPITPTWSKPESLLGFWPLGQQTKLVDLARKMCLLPGKPQLVSNMNGPFYETETAYSVSEKDTFLGYKMGVGLPPTFTISFYLYTVGVFNGGIVTFWPSQAGISQPRLSISYRKLYATLSYLEIWGGANFDEPLASFPIITPRRWNYFAITYDGNMIKVFDEAGLLLGSVSGSIQMDGNARLDVGYGSNGQEKYYISQRDAISCLMVYGELLQPIEISRLPAECSFYNKGKGLPTTTIPLPETTSSEPLAETTTVLPDAPETTTTPKPSPLKPWPRNEALMGLWPLSAAKMFDHSDHRWNGKVGEVLMKQGPFGDPETAVTSEKANEMILEVVEPSFSVAAQISFTVSLFFKKGNTSPKGGIFEIMAADPENTKNFQVGYYNETMLRMSTNKALNYIPMLQQGVFTFISLVYDHTSSLFAIYGEHGLVWEPTNRPQVIKSLHFSNNGIRIGKTSNLFGLQPSDAVSCLSVYHAALNAVEIRQLFDACRILLEAAPCGAPRLPLLLPKPTTGKAEIPKEGQFPYMAAIISGEHHCSATIIDEYWLVTSAKCFQKSKEASEFKVYVGLHDMIERGSNSREHQLDKIMMSGSTKRDIALVTTKDPIDFSNIYVNNICLDMTLGKEAKYYVFGWGENGRPSFVSQTLPRYVSGQLTENAECEQAWGDGYKADEESCFISDSSATKNVPCNGDEGSPLLAWDGNSNHLVQIGAYYGRDAACSGPALFVSLSAHSKWISEQMACAIPGPYSLYPKCAPQ